MTLVPIAPSTFAAGARPGWGQRRQQRRRLARLDLLAAQRAGLHHIRGLVVDARVVVDAGWIRGSWFAYRDEHGRDRTVTAHTLDQLGSKPVTAACLVGAIIQAGGGLGEVGTQPVQRALDLTWHTLVADAGETIRWCPPPSIRAAHLRDLTRWNDHTDRTQHQVSDLLRSVEAAALAEIGLASTW